MYGLFPTFVYHGSMRRDMNIDPLIYIFNQKKLVKIAWVKLRETIKRYKLLAITSQKNIFEVT